MINYKQEELRRAVKNLRKSKYRNSITLSVKIISYKRYKKDTNPIKGNKGTQDRIKWDNLMKRANGRPLKWAESELGIGDIPKEWTKEVEMSLNQLLSNWKEDI